MKWFRKNYIATTRLHRRYVRRSPPSNMAFGQTVDDTMVYQWYRQNSVTKLPWATREKFAGKNCANGTLVFFMVHFFFFFSKSIYPYTCFDKYYTTYALFWTAITTKHESFTKTFSFKSWVLKISHRLSFILDYGKGRDQRQKSMEICFNSNFSPVLFSGRPLFIFR